MNSNQNNVSVTHAALPLLGRILLAAIFLVSAFGKITAPAGTIGFIESVGLPVPVLSYLASITIELGGGLLLLVGFQTRFVAAGLAAFSVISALIFHNALGDQNQLFHFMKNLSMAGGLIQVVAFGAGAFSIDNRKTFSPTAYPAR